MNIEQLKKQLEEKESLKERTFMIYHQLIGQIEMLRSLIKTQLEENKVVEDPTQK